MPISSGMQNGPESDDLCTPQNAGQNENQWLQWLRDDLAGGFQKLMKGNPAQILQNDPTGHSGHSPTFEREARLPNEAERTLSVDRQSTPNRSPAPSDRLHLTTNSGPKRAAAQRGEPPCLLEDSDDDDFSIPHFARSDSAIIHLRDDGSSDDNVDDGDAEDLRPNSRVDAGGIGSTDGAAALNYSLCTECSEAPSPFEGDPRVYDARRTYPMVKGGQCWKRRSSDVKTPDSSKWRESPTSDLNDNSRKWRASDSVGRAGEPTKSDRFRRIQGAGFNSSEMDRSFGLADSPSSLMRRYPSVGRIGTSNKNQDLRYCGGQEHWESSPLSVSSNFADANPSCQSLSDYETHQMGSGDIHIEFGNSHYLPQDAPDQKTTNGFTACGPPEQTAVIPSEQQFESNYRLTAEYNSSHPDIKDWSPEVVPAEKWEDPASDNRFIRSNGSPISDPVCLYGQAHGLETSERRRMSSYSDTDCQPVLGTPNASGDQSDFQSFARDASASPNEIDRSVDHSRQRAVFNSPPDESHNQTANRARILPGGFSTSVSHCQLDASARERQFSNRLTNRSHFFDIPDTTTNVSARRTIHGWRNNSDAENIDVDVFPVCGGAKPDGRATVGDVPTIQSPSTGPYAAAPGVNLANSLPLPPGSPSPAQVRRGLPIDIGERSVVQPEIDFRTYDLACSSSSGNYDAPISPRSFRSSSSSQCTDTKQAHNDSSLHTPVEADGDLSGNSAERRRKIYGSTNATLNLISGSSGLAKCRKAIAEHHEEILKQRRATRQAENQMKSQARELNRVKQQLETQRNLTLQMEDENRQIGAKVAAKEARICELEDAIAVDASTQQNAMAAVGAQCEKLKANVRDNAKCIEALKSQLSEADVDRDHWKTERLAHKKQMTELENVLSDAKSDLESLRRQNMRKQEEMEAEHSATVCRMTREHNAERLEALQREKDHEVQKFELQKQLDHERQEKTEVQEEVARRTRQAKNEISDLNLELQQLRSVNRDLTKAKEEIVELRKVKLEFAQSKAKHEKLETDHQKLIQEKDATVSECARLQAEICAAQSVAAKLESKLLATEDDLNAAKCKIDAANDAAEEAKKKAENFKEKYHQLCDDCHKLQKLVRSKEREMAKFEESVSSQILSAREEEQVKITELLTEREEDLRSDFDMKVAKLEKKYEAKVVRLRDELEVRDASDAKIRELMYSEMSSLRRWKTELDQWSARGLPNLGSREDPGQWKRYVSEQLREIPGRLERRFARIFNHLPASDDRPMNGSGVDGKVQLRSKATAVQQVPVDPPSQVASQPLGQGQPATSSAVPACTLLDAMKRRSANRDHSTGSDSGHRTVNQLTARSSRSERRLRSTSPAARHLFSGGGAFVPISQGGHSSMSSR